MEENELSDIAGCVSMVIGFCLCLLFVVSFLGLAIWLAQKTFGFVFGF